jgi:AcrR family transcriptional regulator
MVAARALITEKGVAGLRIAEITERADVSLGSFYNYFETKEMLVDAVVGESLESLASSLAAGTVADQDPAELVGEAIRRFVSLAYDEPSFAQLIVHLNHADTVFAVSVAPFARLALERAIDAGRVAVVDLDVAVAATIGGSLAIMRGIVDGRIGPGAEIAFAESQLRAFGLDRAEAHEIANRPLPDVHAVQQPAA